MKDVNIPQMLWIYKQAELLLREYGSGALSDGQAADLIEKTDNIVKLAKGNEYCKKIIIDVLCVLNAQETM